MVTATRPRLSPITIRRGGIEDLSKLVALIRELHRRSRAPHTVEWTVQVLQIALPFPVTHLLILEDRVGLCGYCWCEIMVTGELLVHQIFLMAGRDPRPLHDYLVALAREHECTSLCGLTYRRGGVRGFGRWGLRPKAILMSKEVS